MFEEVLPSIRKTGSYNLNQGKLSEEDKLKMVESLLERKFKNKNIAAQLTLKACSIIVPEFTPLLEEAKIELSKENAISGNELYSIK